MSRYMKGDRVEVLKTNGTLEDSWHPAQIVGGNGDAYTVLYDGHANGVVEERVSVRCIRPCPPLVEFSDWSRGDLVHVFDNFAWKLATVLQVLDKKQFLVRVVGSMQDLKVGAAWIRIRHYWQDDQWIIIGKGPSNSNVKPPFIRRHMISESQAQQRNTSARAARRSTHLKCHHVPTKAVERNVPSTLDQTEARRGLKKISRTVERSSSGTLNHIKACTGTGMRSRVTEQHEGLSLPSATNAILREAQNEQQEDSGLSSIGSCSINSNFSGRHYPIKFAEHLCQGDVSDAESCTGPSPMPRKQTVVSLFQKKDGKLCWTDTLNDVVWFYDSATIPIASRSGIVETVATELHPPFHTSDDSIGPLLSAPNPFVDRLIHRTMS